MPGSKRVNPQNWAIRVVPWLIVLITIALVITLVVLASSLLGFTPE
jgi:hypothetical protein